MKPSLLLAVLMLSLAACSPKPMCDASSCAGCCDSAGACQGGFTQTGCGQFGSSCDVCVGLQTCQLGRCTLPSGSGGGTGGGSGGGSGGGTGGGTGGGSGGGGGGGSLGACGARGECATGVCNRPTNTCVTCRSPIDCEDGFVCTSGACVAATPCTSDLDCTPAGKVCDTSGGRCVQCKGSAECPSGQACIGFACTSAMSCMSSLECTARKQVCAPATPPRFPATVTQACQDCASNNDCPMGDECREGVCVDVCGARVCGDVNGVACGTCPLPGPFGQPQCLEPGRACLSLAASTNTSSSGDSTTFVSGALMWTERFSAGSVYALNLASGALDEVSTGESYPEGVGATATTYYWGAEGGIFQRARTGGTRSSAAAFSSTNERCISLAIAPGQLYCGVYSSVGNEGVFRAPISGGVPLTRVVTEDYPTVLTRGQNVFFLGSARLGFHDAVANTATNLLTHNGSVSAPIFADDAAVYFWRDEATRAIKRIDLATRMETVFYAAALDESGLIAGVSDGVDAYLLIRTNNGTRLRKVKVASRVTTVFAEDLPISGQSSPVALQLEPNALLVGVPGYAFRVAPR
jgi:hypothetical protein